MAKQIARLLKADIQESSDLKSIAKMLSKKGRGGDTMLAHITPKEAKILKEAGGAGTVNPDTGLLEFYDGGFNIGSYGDDYRYGADYGRQQARSYDYIPPQQSYDSPYTFDAGAAPIELTAPDIDPQQYYAQQYSPSSVSSIYDVGYGQPTSVGITAPGPQQVGVAAPAATDFYATPEVARIPSAVSPYQLTQPAITAPAGTAPTPSLLTRAGDQLKALQEATGLKAADLIRLGGAGAGAVAGRQQAQQAAKQIQQATQEQKNLGKPYQEEGQKLQRAALAGELTPSSAQAYQALRAQMAQGIESRGGVGVAQAQAQLEAFRQNLLQNQYNYGLQVAQIGDNMALGAIRTGMQLDQQLAAANQQFYTQLAAIAGGGTYGYQPPTRTTGGQ